MHWTITSQLLNSAELLRKCLHFLKTSCRNVCWSVSNHMTYVQLSTDCPLGLGVRLPGTIAWWLDFRLSLTKNFENGNLSTFSAKPFDSLQQSGVVALCQYKMTSWENKPFEFPFRGVR